MPTGSLRAALLLALPLFTACKTGVTAEEGVHWGVESVPERMFKHFTGYRSDRDGEFIDYQYEKKKSINRTLRRSFIGNSTESPFEANDPSQTAPRRAHSLAPDPFYYMHLESMFIGAATAGISGTFVPIPLDSVMATAYGGWGEFGRGFTGGGNAEDPPSVREFRVRNR